MSAGMSLTEIWRSAVVGDGRLPPETELADLLGMGRNSVREALIRLEADGYISRRHGAGTFANPAAMDVQVRVDRTQEYADILRGLGCVPRIELLEAGWVEAAPRTLEKLRAEPGTLIFRTCKRWLADGAPVMYAEDLIPARRRVTVDATLSVLEIARIVNGHTTEWVSSLVEARLAGENAAALGVAASQPLLRLEQVGVSRDGQRCWLAKEYHNGNSGQRPLRYGLVRTVMTGSDDRAIGAQPAPGPAA
jgi:DNA-binding GntR family transcriptional regulator